MKITGCKQASSRAHSSPSATAEKAANPPATLSASSSVPGFIIITAPSLGSGATPGRLKEVGSQGLGFTFRTRQLLENTAGGKALLGNPTGAQIQGPLPSCSGRRGPQAIGAGKYPMGERTIATGALNPTLLIQSCLRL